jgi:Mg-chelatase subunit ChlD
MRSKGGLIILVLLPGFLVSSNVSGLASGQPETRRKRDEKPVTVIFLVDTSLSMPVELVDDGSQPGGREDRRARRLVNFLNQAVELRGSGPKRDQAGLIVFGRRPRLELPPGDAPRFNLKEVPAAGDGQHTDIAAALKLALASFPEGTIKRIVLISDGNDNLANVEEQGQIPRLNGVQIDVVPLGSQK